MSSGNGPTIAASQIIVNKAAKKIVIERKIVAPPSSSTKESIPAIESSEKSIKDNSSNDGNAIGVVVEENSTIGNKQSTKDDDDDLEEGEIDVVHSIPSSKTTTTTTTKINGPSENQSISTNGNSDRAADQSQISVQKKLSALERLKSLSFAKSKSAVNPFTLAPAPKPSTTTTTTTTTPENKRRPSPPRIQSQKRQRRSPFPDGQQQANKRSPYDRVRQQQRTNNTMDIDRSELVNRPDQFGRQFGQPPPNLRRDFPYQSPSIAIIDDGSGGGSRGGGNWGDGVRPLLSIRHSEFDGMMIDRRFSPQRMAEERRFSPQSPRLMEPTDESQPPAAVEDFATAESTYAAPSSSTIDWNKLHDLSITHDDLNESSIADLRTIVQHLLDKETHLIRDHLRLSDQIRNVRRTLDRSKQIEQLKKQAFVAALAVKRAKEAKMAAMAKEKGSQLMDTSMESAETKDESDHEAKEAAADDRILFEEALKKTISEQAEAKRRYLREYFQTAGGPSHQQHHQHHQHQHPHRYQQQPYHSNSIGAPNSYDQYDAHSSTSAEQSSSPSSSVSIPKEQFVAMLTSFFDGVASMKNDRSHGQDNTST